MKKNSKSTRESQRTQLQVTIETPHGNRNKFKYDPASESFKLSKVMPEGMVFPYDFGFVPSTKADDGDPLDVLVLTDEALFPGCLVDCKLIGVIEAEQEEKGKKNRNDRLIAAASASLLYSELRTLDDLNPVVLKQIQDFSSIISACGALKSRSLDREGLRRPLICCAAPRCTSMPLELWTFLRRSG